MACRSPKTKSPCEEVHESSVHRPPYLYTLPAACRNVFDCQHSQDNALCEPLLRDPLSCALALLVCGLHVCPSKPTYHKHQAAVETHPPHLQDLAPTSSIPASCIERLDSRSLLARNVVFNATIAPGHSPSADSLEESLHALLLLRVKRCDHWPNDSRQHCCRACVQVAQSLHNVRTRGLPWV